MDLTVFLSVVLFIVIALLLGLLVYSGLLADISVEARKSPYDELLVYYRTHIGPYADVGDLFRATQQLAPNNRLVGIYLDDPKCTPSDCCRSAIGAIVPNPAADAATVQRLESAGYVSKLLPKADNVVYCTFPLINRVSVYISAWRVYPAMRDYLTENGLTARPFIEICEGSRLVFLAPLSRYEEFQPDIKPPSVPQQVQEQVQEPVQERVKDQVQEQVPVQKKVQEEEPVQAPVQEPVQEQMQEPVQAPVQAPVQEPVQEQLQEPVHVQRQEREPQVSALTPELSTEPAEVSTEELISEAVAENTESSAPLSPAASGGEVETVFENRQDLLEAIADRPDEAGSKTKDVTDSSDAGADSMRANADSEAGQEAGEGMDFGDEADDANANADLDQGVGEEAGEGADFGDDAAGAEAEGEGDEALEALEQRLAQLEEDLTDKQSRVRSDVTQYNNSLALAEIEEHLRRTVPEPETQPDSNSEQAQSDAQNLENPQAQDGPDLQPSDEATVTSAEFAISLSEDEKPEASSQHQTQLRNADEDKGQEAEAAAESVPLIQLQPAEPLPQADMAADKTADEADAATDAGDQSVDAAQVNQFIQSVVQRAQQICEAEAAAALTPEEHSGDDADPGTERREKRLPSPLRHQTSRSSLSDSPESPQPAED